MRALLVLASLLLLALGSSCESDGGCKDDYDCPEARVCRVSTGTCELPCEASAQCPDGEECVAHHCVVTPEQE